MEQTRSLAFLKIALAIYVFAFWLIPPATAGVIGPDNYDFARFGSSVSWSAPGQFVGWTFTTGDFNGDHRIDLLAYAHNADGWRTHLALAVGDGSFSVPVSWNAAGNWGGWTFALADVNGDGRDDMVMRANDNSSLRSWVALSLGNGSFAAPVAWQVTGQYSGWTSALDDVNADGHVDLILQLADASGWQARVALGLGNGQFATPIAWSAPGMFAGWNIALGDFNSDNRADLLLDYNGPDGWRTWVALSNGNGSFASPVSWQVAGGFGGWVRRYADFNGDGRMDLQLQKYDATSWHSSTALATGTGSFSAPVTWTSASLGSSWIFGFGDVNGDGGADVIAQRADATGWEAAVAVSLGDGTFIAPKAWGTFDGNFAGGWTFAVGDVSGDGKADVLVYAADAASWQTWSALAQGCDVVIGSDEDFVGQIAALQSQATQQRVCLKPGVYDREILIAGKQNLAFIAAHGGATIETSSFGFLPDAVPGLNPGAPVQIYESDSIEFDGFTIRNLFTYQLRPDQDQQYMVSRAMEVILSNDITLSHVDLVGRGKQLLHTETAQNLVVQNSRLDCYYFCLDTNLTSVESKRVHFVANHQYTPTDDHAMFWSAGSDQKYLNCTMEFVTGKSLFAGVNDFDTDLIEIAGQTVVSENAQAWVSQHPNYNGFNVRISGTYTPLASWYFIQWQGPGWQQKAQICYYPDGGQSHCVSHFE